MYSEINVYLEYIILWTKDAQIWDVIYFKLFVA